jgi:hypothetical protein
MDRSPGAKLGYYYNFIEGPREGQPTEQKETGMPDAAQMLQELWDKEAIRDLVYRYSYYFDKNQREEFLDLFAEDCVFDPGPGSGGPVHGRAALADPSRRRALAATSHHNANVLITFDGPGRALVHTTFFAWHRLADGREPLVWGYYDDIVVRHDDRWRFAQRVVRVYGDSGFGTSWNPGERQAEQALG